MLVSSKSKCGPYNATVVAYSPTMFLPGFCRCTDIRIIIQALLGHDKLDTTGMIASIESPLDLLSQSRKKPRKSRKDLSPA